MGIRLEDVTPGAQLGGVVGDATVTVVAATWIGSNALRLAYRTGDGRLDERILYRDYEPRLSLAKASAAYEFQADATSFKLAAEALRIRMAGRFDPMLAVHTSDLEPLPHQIQAVYGELLDRTPLRFLLADDPGAGKTIMAGLYIKELILRGDLERCLVVAPGGLDSDRFESRYRDAVHTVDTEGLMRRMVKEDLKTFEGKPLFPERRAYTVAYELSPGEQDLYDAVTQYVREEMNRADRLKEQGDKKRGFTVGFALTVLQRRLASSPEAILKSLERRRKRLERRRRETQYAGQQAVNDLEELARRVRHSGTDKKWTELRDLLSDNELIKDVDGNVCKIIVFTEHRDTLEYLAERIRGLLGRPEAVVTIHGGIRREERRKVMELFAQDVETRVMVATDAAGEGLNLQRAHLMVNYDLPWNPNRIEQRFGRIHRIGQTEVCHLWNLVAAGTREGTVFALLLDKLEEQRRAYHGRVFDVLGEAFEGQPLRDLLVEAIRYGDRPEIRARLDQVIDARVGEGLDKLIAERAAHRDVLAAADLEKWRARMAEANARRLQPHYIRAFFMAAFRLLGGTISQRESGRYEIRHVPADVRDRDRQIGLGAPVLRRYERVTFEKNLTRPPCKPRADLLAPGHPLLDAVIGSALHMLSDQATYLNNDGARYWYDVAPTVARMAREHADRLRERPDLVHDEILNRLRRHEQRVRGMFAALQIGPETSAEIPDEPAVRLVILHPQFRHTRGEDGSEARVFARDALLGRGNAQRMNRNMIVFLAADAKRYEELDAAIREYLAWQNIAGSDERMEELGLSAQQRTQARRSLAEADEKVRLRIPATYQWVLVPVQPKGQQVSLDELKTETARERLAERAGDKLHNSDMLRDIHGARNIRLNLDQLLSSVWEQGHVGVGKLWEYYCEYVYLPRLAERSVLDRGITDVFSVVAWEFEGFAVAAGFDKSTGKYDLLAIPGEDLPPQITDSTLLVRPERAIAQREQERAAQEAARRASGDGTSEDSGSGESGTGGTSGSTQPPGGGASAAPKNTRFYGVAKIDSDLYVKELTKLSQEIIRHLAADDAHLEICVEITARKAAGYPEDKVRIVTENARTLKLDPYSFEDR